MNLNPIRPRPEPLRSLLRQARRLIILVIGSTVVLLGIVMIVTPGPAMVVIPVGLAILAVEFVWARRLLRRVKTTARWNLRRQRRFKQKRNGKSE